MSNATTYPHLPLRVSEPTERHEDAIYVFDAADNDVATFFHAEHATVSQTYEQALALAQMLAAAAN